jgi:hypothetical protein
MLFIGIIITYFIMVWVITRLVVPHFGFRKDQIPSNIPTELNDKINELNKSSKNNREFLENTYNYITNIYFGNRTKTITQFWRAFGNIFDKAPGFLPCTGQNYLLRTILIKSGRFSEDDIETKIVPLNLFIHQYLKIRIDNQWIDVDPWSHFIGKRIGEKSAYIG